MVTNMNFIVDFKDDTSLETIQKYLNRPYIKVIKIYNAFEKTYLIEASRQPIFDSSIHSYIIRDDDQPLVLLSNVINVDKNFCTNTLTGSTITLDTNNNDDWWKIYSLYQPELDKETIPIDRRGEDITVYILDSGIKADHLDFQGKSISNLFSFNSNFDDNRGHGTAIASVISGNTCGISNASIKSCKIFDNGIPTKQSDLLNALDAIRDDFLQSAQGLGIVNCSWQIIKNEFIESKIRLLINNGLFFVVAAGNSGVPIEDVTPASMPEVITVGSYNQNFEPCDFSNYTGSVTSLTPQQTNSGSLDGWAPGEVIRVATIDGAFGYSAGTSISAGIHSAVMAYNIGQYTIPYILNHNLNSTYEALIGLCFKKDGILDLNDPKYLTSSNRISTIIDQYPKQELNKLPSFIKGISGQKVFSRLFPLPSNVVTIKIFNELPHWVTISNRGILSGVVPELESVTTNFLSMEITTEDGEQIPFTLELIGIPKDYNSETESTGNSDLDVKIRLLDIYCSINECTGTTQFCIDDCFDGNCERGQGKPYGCEVWETFCRCASDERVKKNIQPLKNSLDKVMNINGYRYNYITDNVDQIGFLAGELQKIVPEVVRTRSDGFLEVNYGTMTSLLLESIKELKKEIEELKHKNNLI